jgi:predicted dehydrogenase
MMLKVAVVGMGIGRSHLEAYAKLADRFEVVAVCDLDGDKARAAAAQFGIARVHADVGELLARERLDAIDLCTPPFTHRVLIEQALAAGVHVICEKPLVGSLEDADAVERAARSAKGRVFPIFQYRFGNGLAKLRHLQAKGFARTPYLTTIETSWRREAAYYAVPWRGKWATELGGCCLTQALHAHDILCYVNGRIRTVFAQLATRVNDIEVEDCAAVAIAMENGSVATLAVTLGAVDEISRLRFMFSDLTIESAGTNPYRPGNDPWIFKGRTDEVNAAVRAALADFVPGREAFEGLLEQVHAAIAGDAPSPVSLADARQSLELITAIYHSAATGTAVTLPIAQDHPRYRSWIPDAGTFARAAFDG